MTENIITFVKGEGKKFLSEDSKLIPIITKDGWKPLEEEKAKSGKSKKEV